MLKKIPLMLSIIAALGIGIVASADAKGHGGGHGGGHHGGGHHGGGHHGEGHHGGGRHGGGHHEHATRDVHEHGAHQRYVVGKSYDGHVWFGHSGHRWHGHWYGYGIGPCWIYVDGLWFWNPVACPL